MPVLHLLVVDRQKQLVLVLEEDGEVEELQVSSVVIVQQWV